MLKFGASYRCLSETSQLAGAEVAATMLMDDQQLYYNTPVFKKYQPDDSFKARPLPEPTGAYPFHLSSEQVLPDLPEDRMVFHMVGDTGSLRSPDFQKLVCAQLVKQFKGAVSERPSFLYHLGDVVYNFGERERYYTQFFHPYEDYPAPIFAIPGNHDSDVNPDNPNPYNSLDAFRSVFCTTNSDVIRFSQGSRRKSGLQPNVYWTFETPLAVIVGLYGNVNKFGTVTETQRAWFYEELKTWKDCGKALIVCIHHAPYSADINHGSSLPMIHFLETAFEETGVRPDIVLSGHVHNYQRFKRVYPDGVTVPFIVAGAGGYDELHPVARLDDDRFTSDKPEFANVHLEASCGHRHGFLRVTLAKESGGIKLLTEYYTIPHEQYMESDEPARLEDRMEVQIRRRAQTAVR